MMHVRNDYFRSFFHLKSSEIIILNEFSVFRIILFYNKISF